VFRARDIQTGRIVAVKVLKLDRMFDLARFEREAAMLAAVRSEHIVDYIAHGEAEGIHFLAQEWVDGITLSTHEQTIGTTVREAIVIAHGIARALGAIHKHGVIHRDIKPANIILSGGDIERVKLVDFGIARQTDSAGVLTRTGMLVGTPSYMSPEQARAVAQLGPSADVFSLGCVLYEAMTGTPPFTGKSFHAIRAKLLLGDPLPLAEQCPEASQALCALVHGMLAKAPENRPVDGWDVVERLLMLPAIAEGPRRTSGKQHKTPPRTPVATGSGPRAVNAFVMFEAASVRAAGSAHDRKLAEIGQRHNLDVHVFDDGSAVMSSREQSSRAAVEAVRAAVELRREVDDAAVSVCGPSGDVNDTIAEVLDRGSVLLERANMGALFSDVVDDDDGQVIHLDDVIAEIVVEEVPVEQGPDGPVIRVR